MLKIFNFKKALCLGVVFVFLMNILGPLPAQADQLLLPKPGVMVHLSSVMNPPILKGLKVYPDNPFRFEFIMDQGDGSRVDQKEEANRLIKYFLASLTIPEKDLWVNLSPYEKDRIVPESFGVTEMGRDLLAEDYMLKQITASLIYPEDEIGKKFWKRIYEEAQAKYHTTNIPVNTFNKVWIVPEKAVVYENSDAGTAYVVESRLKVMLECDYLSLSKHDVGVGSKPTQMIHERAGLPAGQAGLEPAPTETNQIGSQIIREIVIPELTKEINQGANFAKLRQVYNSLILATWYKKKIKDSILSQVYSDKNKTAGIEYVGVGSKPTLSKRAGLPAGQAGLEPAPTDVELIYQQYLSAFKKGVYNYIKEEQDPLTQQSIPRKYFSGGFGFAGRMNAAMTVTSQTKSLLKKITLLGTSLFMIGCQIKPEVENKGQVDQSPPKQSQVESLEKLASDPAIASETRNLSSLFNIWAKGQGARDELIYRARQLGFEGVYFENYKSKEMTGNINDPLTPPYLNYFSFFDLFYNGMEGNLRQHGFGNGVYLWRETMEGFEFIMFDYGSGVIDEYGRPLADIGQIFDEQSYRKGRPSADGKGGGSGAGMGLNFVAAESYLTRFISVNDGHVVIADKAPGFIRAFSKGNKVNQKRYRQADLGVENTTMSGAIVQGFVPIDRSSYVGRYTSIDETNILGEVQTTKAVPRQRGSWQMPPAQGLENLKEGDRITVTFYLTSTKRELVDEQVIIKTLPTVRDPYLVNSSNQRLNINDFMRIRTRYGGMDTDGGWGTLEAIDKFKIRIGDTVSISHYKHLLFDEKQEISGIIKELPSAKNQGAITIETPEGKARIISMAQIKEFKLQDQEGNSKKAEEIIKSRDNVQTAKDQAMNVNGATATVTPRTTMQYRNQDVISMLASDRFLQRVGLDLKQGSPRVIQVGAGAYPFEALELKEALNQVNPGIEVVSSELPQSTPLAHLRMDEFLSFKFKKWLADNYYQSQVFKAEDINDVFLVIDQNHEISEVVVGHTHQGVQEYLTVGINPELTLQQNGETINEKTMSDVVYRKCVAELKVKNFDIGQLKQIIIGSTQDKFKVDGKPIRIEKQPLHTLLASKGIKFISDDNLAKPELGVQEASIVLASSLTIHLSKAEEAAFIESMKSVLKQGGVLIIKNEYLTTGHHIEVYQKDGEELKKIGVIRRTRALDIEADGVFKDFTSQRSSIEGKFNLHIQKTPGFTRKHHELMKTNAVNVGWSTIFSEIIPDQDMINKAIAYLSKKLNLKIGKLDLAMIHADTETIANTGGIDLTKSLNLTTQKTGGEIKFNIDPAMLQHLQKAPGFYPVIMNITPLEDLKGFLGVNHNSVEEKGLAKV